MQLQTLSPKLWFKYFTLEKYISIGARWWTLQKISSFFLSTGSYLPSPLACGCWPYTLDHCRGCLSHLILWASFTCLALLAIQLPACLMERFSWIHHECPPAVRPLSLSPLQILRFHISVVLAQPERGKRKLIRGALFWVTKRFALKIHPIRAYLHCCLYEAASVSDNSRNTLALELAAFPKCPAGRVGQRRAAAGERGKDTLAYLKIKINQRSLSLISTDVSSLESRQLPTYI